jgi:CheY-like chemotaxis protein
MSTNVMNGLEPSPANRQSVAARVFDPSAMDRTAPSGDKVLPDSEIMQILIVDDDYDVLKLVARMATILGYRPTTAEDALDALSRLNKKHYDLVLTDYKMPFIDGYELAGQIKKKRSGTKVIIMTGHCDQTFTDMLEGSDVVDGLLLKPFNLQTMKEKLEWAGKFHIGRLTP